MKQEKLLKTLIAELMALNELHQEYQDNDTHFVVDSQREGNTLTIKVQLIENKDKKEFEKWLEGIDDSFLGEILEELEDVKDLNSLYETERYKEVIDTVKAKAKEIALRKINQFQKFIN